MEVYAANVERMMRRMYGSLNERDRRWYAAVESAKQGHGGIEYVARVVGCDPKTVRLGLDEMESEAEPLVDRQQKKRGPKLLTETSPELVENFLVVLKDHVAGDPMRADVKWTNLSRRKISHELTKLGTPAGRDVVSDLLWEHGYRRRKTQEQKTMGQHVDRDRQFQRIAELKNEFQQAGQPVISIEIKKKELLGNFQRPGVTDGEHPLIVNDHDFVSQGNGTLIPHGIYDVTKNHGSLHLNTSHDTTALCCDSIRLWWNQQGQADYPQATQLLVLCDGGGSNSASKHIF